MWLVTHVNVKSGVGSETGAAGGAGWARDSASAPLDLAPALLAAGGACGARWLLAAAGGAALAQAAARAAAGASPAAAVEAPRRARLRGAAPVNAVRQRADALLSHADARAHGLAARF
ncbi:unnamed protein product, partial [Iphiclides podalirius]